MRRFGAAGGGWWRGGAALLLCLLPGLAAAQASGPLPPRLTAADLPELTPAASDGLRIGRAALAPEAPLLPPARTAARVPALRLAPADPQVALLAPVAPEGRLPAVAPEDRVLAVAPEGRVLTAAPPEGRVLGPVATAALPQTTWLSLAVLPRVTPAAAPRAPLPEVLAASAPRARAAAVPADRLPPLAPAPLAGKWLDPQDPADRGVLEGIFGAALPPGLMLEPPAPADPRVLALAVQTELKRLNCYRGALDGDFGRGSRAAVEAYGKASGRMPETLDPTSALLRDLKALPEGKLCPDPPKPAAPAATSSSRPQQQEKTPTQRQQPAAPAPQPAPKPARKQPDIAIIGL